MRFSAATISGILFGAAVVQAAALPAPAPAEGDKNAQIPASQSVNLTGKKQESTFVEQLEPTKRDLKAVDEAAQLAKRGAIVVVLGIAGTAALAKITEIAIEIGTDTIKNLGEWNEARETFTKTTTQEMWDRNPDYARFPAAACYNKGYRLRDPAKVEGLVSVGFELGLLKTDFDCMYIEGPNQFFTDSDGGFINLSYTFDPARCSFDSATGDLSCN